MCPRTTIYFSLSLLKKQNEKCVDWFVQVHIHSFNRAEPGMYQKNQHYSHKLLYPLSPSADLVASVSLL